MAATRITRGRLSPESEKFLDDVLEELRKSGASDEEINNASPGLTDAVFAASKAKRYTEVSSTIVFYMIAATIILIPMFVYSNVEGIGKSFLIGDLGYLRILFFTFVLMMFTRLIINRVLKPVVRRILSINSPIFHKGHIGTLIVAILILMWLLIVNGLEVWHEQSSRVRQWSIWEFAIIFVSGIWIYTCFQMLNKISTYLRNRVLAVLRPDWALISSLCHAFLAVRDDTLWHDQAHRNQIAANLGLAVETVEKFMPRYFVIKTDISSMAMIRRRFKQAAIPLRQELLWLATPGPLTRTDLEAELRKALIAASSGQLHQLGREVASTEMVETERRSWWGVLIDSGRALAWALTPLVLIWLGSALQLPLLSDHDQQMAAQKAAYLWLGVAILRWMSPGNFKETVDAAAGLLGRGKEK